MPCPYNSFAVPYSALCPRSEAYAHTAGLHSYVCLFPLAAPLRFSYHMSLDAPKPGVLF